VPFTTWHNHVGAKRCYGSKLSKGGFIKVTSGLMGPMRKGDTIMSLWWVEGAKRITMWLKEVPGGFKAIPTQFGELKV
jgi:hypothetical protein